MDSTYSVDRFVAGLLLGALVSWIISSSLDHWGLSSCVKDGLALRLAMEAVAAGCLILPRPLLRRTIFRSRRSVFIRDEDVRAMLQGRVVGMWVASGLVRPLTACSFESHG
jgi:hypothetical protein